MPHAFAHVHVCAPQTVRNVTCYVCIYYSQNLSAARNNLFKSPAWSVISVIVLTSAAHIFYLIANYIVIRYDSMSRNRL